MLPSIAQCPTELYEAQLAAKLQPAAQQIASAVGLDNPEDLPEPQVFESQREHFRMRAAFNMWREGDEVHYTMFNEGDARTPVQVTRFPMGSRITHARG